jgi:hypothetical protein
MRRRKKNPSTATWLIFGAIGALGYWLYKQTQSGTVPSTSTLQPPSTGLLPSGQPVPSTSYSTTPGPSSGTTVLPSTPASSSGSDGGGEDYVPTDEDLGL